jgi:hypothetical protein
MTVQRAVEAYRKRNMAKGLCKYCPKKRVEGSKTSCAYHVQKRKERYLCDKLKGINAEIS